MILLSNFTAGIEGTNEIPRSGKLATMLKVEVGNPGVQVFKYTNANSTHIMKVQFYSILGSGLSFLSCLEIFLSHNLFMCPDIQLKAGTLLYGVSEHEQDNR